ncbi:glycoside hydrolase domain-containing protein [Olivibacter sitiensis]|uniref:glycoside hydrolase domain-containing protein n=1 Tax=Olivibacter sitiensis TaxID=376470 RepID=UPI000420C5E9|nr:glycoside hydrolase domain-containing protein [Olivibacter sitiensis]
MLRSILFALIGGLIYLYPPLAIAQADRSSQVNVFLGSSGDHGQLSPAASYPFSMLSIGPSTYPFTHTGYEYLAKDFYGFTHNRFEGVGCQGSGGILLVKPFLENTTEQEATPLQKLSDYASPGAYGVRFSNGIQADLAVYGQSGIHRYQYPKGKKGISIDLKHTFNRAFVSEKHQVQGQVLTGYIEARTTCHAGTYRIYYALKMSRPVKWTNADSTKIIAIPDESVTDIDLYISFSSVDEQSALASLLTSDYQTFAQKSNSEWNKLLNRFQVKGDDDRTRLFYSLLYRTLQSPYNISNPSGQYRAIDGSLQQASSPRYNGWAIWDNFKTQLPLLALAYPERFGDIAQSIANLYPHGKKDFATEHEPSNTVRTEHAIVALIDAHRKGFAIDFASIIDSLQAEVDRLDFSKPDKALESSYDTWALAEIYAILGNETKARQHYQKASEYKNYWLKDFADLSKPDVDRMSARNMYQGTIRQYRWSVPFDIAGLKALMGGEQEFVNQLDDFFDHHYFNRTNEPDLQVPALYQASNAPWKSQAWMHQFAVDTVINHYFNDNSRGIGSEIDVIFKNQPAAFIRTMDDDAGAMSSWFIFSSLGLYPAAIGWPIYYLHLPLFEEITLDLTHGRKLHIQVNNYAKDKRYIQDLTFNGEKIERNWISHEELMQGGELIFTASDSPNKTFGIKDQWISTLREN